MHRRDTVVSGSPKKSDKSYPFVSQICFSDDQHYVGCLVSGSVNRVVIYEWKVGKKVPVVS